jgi:hypothetical protein
MRTYVLVGLAAAALAGCGPGVKPPTTRGVCWLMSLEQGQPRFAPLTEYNDSLNSCAGQIEAVRMRGGHGDSLTGAYNGHFIFVSEDVMQTADRLDGNRSHLFTPALRAELQKQIRAALKADPEFGTVRAQSQPAS